MLVGVGRQANAVETREYLLGDIDGFVYNGPGSVDDVYIDPAWQDYWGESPFLNDFDQIEDVQIVLFSFLFDLSDNEQIIGGELTVGLRATTLDNPANWLSMEGSFIRPSFYNLNWDPLSMTETTERRVNLDNVSGYNVIPLLQDGLLNVGIHRNAAVDYAILSTVVIPEPATLLLFGLSGLLLRSGENLCGILTVKTV